MTPLGVATLVLEASAYAILAYFILVNTFYAVQLLAAVLELLRHARENRGEPRHHLLDSPLAPRVSVLAPAYNEEATIRESVRGMLTLDYPNLEVVVVNDGSRDGTLRALLEEFDMRAVEPMLPRRLPTKRVRGMYRSRTHPQLVVLDKENGGKADALNAALDAASGDLVCAVDADTLIEPDAVQRMVRPFLKDDRIVATGGTIRVVNGSLVRGGRVVERRVPRRFLPGIQSIEYTRAFLFGRLGLNRLGGNLVISGAFGLFRREDLLRVGGYDHGTVGEDMEIIVRLRRHDRPRRFRRVRPGRLLLRRGPEHALASPRRHLVRFVPDPVAWTEAPDSLRVLGRQRERWHRGLSETLRRHGDLLLNPRQGSLGLVSYPAFLLAEWLAPLVEAFGLAVTLLSLTLGVLDWSFALAFVLFAYGYALVLTLAALLMEELSFGLRSGAADRLVAVGWALLETFGYRQLTVWWRLKGIVGFLRNRKGWGDMQRKGFRTKA